MENIRLDQYTVFRKDNDGHKYVIPQQLSQRFDEIMDQLNIVKFGSREYYDLNDALDGEFGQYMVG